MKHLRGVDIQKCHYNKRPHARIQWKSTRRKGGVIAITHSPNGFRAFLRASTS